MLVLTRKKDERIVITVHGVEVNVHLLLINGDRVRIGVDGDADAKVLRGELFDAQETAAAG